MGNSAETMQRREGMRLNTLESAGGTKWMNCQCNKNPQPRCQGGDNTTDSCKNEQEGYKFTRVEKKLSSGKVPGMRPGHMTDIGTDNVQVKDNPSLIGGFNYYGGPQV